MTTHPQLLHVLAAIRDAIADIAPEESSLDLISAQIFTVTLRNEARKCGAFLLPESALLTHINVAMAAVESAEEALSATVERHRISLAELQHAVSQAQTNAPAAPIQVDEGFDLGSAFASPDPLRPIVL